MATGCLIPLFFHINSIVQTHREQRRPGSTGLVRHAFLSCEDVLQVFPHVFVEDDVEEEDENAL